MNSPTISIIVAHGENREIGAGNDLLWRIPEDSKRFKDITMGHPVIMGRKTYESIPEKFRPLPGRTNIIVTRDKTYGAPGATVTHSLKDALEEAEKVEDHAIFVAGGGEIYRQALAFTDRLYITVVHQTFPEADTFFPRYGEFTKEIESEKKEDVHFSYTFKTLER